MNIFEIIERQKSKKKLILSTDHQGKVESKTRLTLNARLAHQGTHRTHGCSSHTTTIMLSQIFFILNKMSHEEQNSPSSVKLVGGKLRRRMASCAFQCQQGDSGKWDWDPMFVGVDERYTSKDICNNAVCDSQGGNCCEYSQSEVMVAIILGGFFFVFCVVPILLFLLHLLYDITCCSYHRCPHVIRRENEREREQEELELSEREEQAEAQLLVLAQ